jgi:hypothetical protein
MSSLARIIRSGLIWRALPPAEGADNNNHGEKEQQKSPIKEQFYPVSAKQCQDLHELCVEQFPPTAQARNAHRSCLSFGIDSIDRDLPAPGLPAGTVHEWSLRNPLNDRNNTPHSLFAWMAFRAWKQLERNSAPEKNSSAELRFIFWIGRDVWPSPHTLAQIAQGENRKGAFFGQNIFIDVANEKERLWSVETALRSPAAALVIAPLSTPSLTVSRRLLLAAERGGGVGLLSIPRQMQAATTAALSRWEVTPVPSPSDYARWRLALVKWKGAHLKKQSWHVELSPPSIRDLYFSGVADNSLANGGAADGERAYAAERSSGDLGNQRQSRERTGEPRRTADAFSLHIPADVVDRAVQETGAESGAIELMRQSG